MGFAYRHLESGLRSDGKAWERGTYTLDGGDTTGNIVSGSSTDFPSTSPKISRITTCSLSSDGDTNTTWAADVARNTAKITCAANDTGTYLIEGPSAG